jgi:hypothetical protein
VAVIEDSVDATTEAVVDSDWDTESESELVAGRVKSGFLDRSSVSSVELYFYVYKNVSVVLIS